MTTTAGTADDTVSSHLPAGPDSDLACQPAETRP